MLRGPFFVVVAFALAFTRPASAQTPALRVGDPAPPLAVSKWLKGGPVVIEKDRVYVVELCATWSPTLRDASIPFLNRLHARYQHKDVAVAGVSVRESNRAAAETFVTTKAPPIEYAFGTDDVPAPPANTPDDRVWAVENGKMSASWLKASGRNAVPTAYIVDRAGRVAWIGNTLFPRGELEAALERVLAGDFTPEAAAALSEQYRAREQKEKDADAKYRRALNDRDYRAAVAALDELIGLDEPFFLPFAARPKFEILLTQLRDPKGACAFASSALEGGLKDHAQSLNDMAWILLVAPGVAPADRDLDLALRLAVRADELLQHKRPDVIDTLARVHYERRDFDRAIALEAEAVEIQRRAVEAAPAPNKERATRLLQELEATLKRYQEEKAKKGGG